jgi:hyaluronan synthase
MIALMINSVARIKETIEKMKTEGGADLANRVHYVVQPVNKGKREALALGAKMAKGELVAFVDSDSFLEPFAIINLIQPFHDLEGGWCFRSY